MARNSDIGPRDATVYNTDEPTIKVILLGNSNVGKSCLINRYITDSFNPYQHETVGAAFFDKNVKVKERVVKLRLWDTAGDERYRSFVRLYFRGAKAALICFDLTDRKSWDDVPYWIETLLDKEELCKIYLVGTKSDLLTGMQPADRAVSEEEIRLLIQRQQKPGCIKQYYETSSRFGQGVDKLFGGVAECVFHELPPLDNDNSRVTLHRQTNSKGMKGKCSC